MLKKKKNRVPVEEAGGVLEIVATNPEGEEVDTSALEEGGIAFDPTRMHLDLTKAEKRRTTALMMAIQAYDKLIIKDAEYLREAHSQARSTGAVIQPATMDAMVIAALQFDAFIAGRLTGGSQTRISRESQSAAPAAEEPKSDGAIDPSVAAQESDPRA